MRCSWPVRTAIRRDTHRTRVARLPSVGVPMNILSEVAQLLGCFQQRRLLQVPP